MAVENSTTGLEDLLGERNKTLPKNAPQRMNGTTHDNDDTSSLVDQGGVCVTNTRIRREIIPSKIRMATSDITVESERSWILFVSRVNANPIVPKKGWNGSFMVTAAVIATTSK